MQQHYRPSTPYYILKFSLKKVVSLSRGHVIGNTHLNFGFSKGGLKAQWST